jgi:hypothetical protein
MKKLNCLSIQEKENTRLIYREKTILGEAEYHDRSPKPTTSARARPPPQHGGRRGPWGLQATGPNLMPTSTAMNFSSPALTLAYAVHSTLLSNISCLLKKCHENPEP